MRPSVRIREEKAKEMWFIFKTFRRSRRADGPHPSDIEMTWRSAASSRSTGGTTPVLTSLLANLVISDAILIKLMGPDPKHDFPGAFASRKIILTNGFYQFRLGKAGRRHAMF
ncbi:hypothetical protein FHY56_08800 [Brucella gallinifaecis]|uniref:Uncharacterized protein n=1 Tax=Brucella gallinifaecis TaxID=215590 RepID=A0A502BNG1_9HYPH|nr:hypothetical protein FHY56_08800 [Brucella gallinifaecis]